MSSSTRRRILKIVRRVHLYVGLFLVPWLLLYGTTALLFNHPDWMHTRTMDQLSEQVLVSTGFEEPVDAQRAADAAWLSINEALGERAVDATLSNQRVVGRYRVRTSGESGRTTIYISPQATGGTLYQMPAEPEITHPLSSLPEISIPDELRPSQQDVDAVVSALGIDHEGGRLDRYPTLMFDAQTDDSIWRFEVNLKNGSVSTEHLGSRQRAPTARSFLTRLHKLHVYPASYSARWLWSLVVDFMGTAMIVWGLTGLVMWWQLRSVRRIGFFVASAGVGSIAALAVLLYCQLGY